MSPITNEMRTDAAERQTPGTANSLFCREGGDDRGAVRNPGRGELTTNLSSWTGLTEESWLTSC